MRWRANNAKKVSFSTPRALEVLDVLPDVVGLSWRVYKQCPAVHAVISLKRGLSAGCYLPAACVCGDISSAALDLYLLLRGMLRLELSCDQEERE